MRKTPTIFDRDWEGNRGVVPMLLVNPGGAQGTEKLDGTNVRVTVRSGILVRVEARMNPPKALKQAFDISEPWYRDAWVYGAEVASQDQYIQEAALNTFLEDIPDGEWSAEAVGPKIQGNPLNMDEHVLYFFDRDQLPGDVCVPVLDDVPLLDGLELVENVESYFNALRSYLDDKRSVVNPEVGIEGIVWHGDDGWAKLKRKDFKCASEPAR